jgi:nicotinate-nucleotide adenylyltransferase
MIRAVLGGSFDPFHNGHLAMVRTVLQRGLADRILVVPAQQSPHKAPPLVDGSHRLKMARLALAEFPEADVLSWEIDRGGVSYTVQTLEQLAAAAPDSPLRLVLGADNLDALARWHRPERIMELATFIVFARQGWPAALGAELGCRVRIVGDFAVPVSASAVRAELAAGRWPRAWLPSAVLSYIDEHGLYGRARDGRRPAVRERP